MATNVIGGVCLGLSAVAIGSYGFYGFTGGARYALLTLAVILFALTIWVFSLSNDSTKLVASGGMIVAGLIVLVSVIAYFKDSKRDDNGHAAFSRDVSDVLAGFFQGIGNIAVFIVELLSGL